MNMNKSRSKIKPPYKPGSPTRPLIIVRGYPQSVDRKAIQEYLESFGKLDQIIFRHSHITIQYAIDDLHKTLQRTKLRFGNKFLSIKVIKKKPQRNAKGNQMPKNKNFKLKDINVESKSDLKNKNVKPNSELKNTNVKPEDKNVNPKNKNENSKKMAKLVIDPLQLINELTKIYTADEQLIHLMKKIQLPYQTIETNHLVLCQYLESVLSNEVFAVKGCRAMPFGSTVTGVAFNWSELDIFIENLNISNNLTNDPRTIDKYVIETKNTLQRLGSFYDYRIGKKNFQTKYIKCNHEPTGITLNIFFKDTLGVCNSNLIYFLLNSDVRLRPMMIVIKYWAKINDITGSEKMSNYALVLLLIFYLQQNPNSILPNISMLQNPSFEKIVAGWNTHYNDKFNFYTLNDNSIPYLLHDFFEFYSNYDFSTKVVSPFSGMSIHKPLFYNSYELDDIFWLYKKRMLNNECTKLEVDTCICIQDPFEHNNNITRNVNYIVVNIFQQCCMSAALICRKAIDSKSIISLLPQLFKEVRCKYEITILPTSSTNQNIDITWYTRVNEILFIILKKIMKFDISLSKHNQPHRYDDDIVESFNIACIGYFEVHHNRTKILKKIQNQLEGLNGEIAISDYIVENFNQSRILNKNPILKMDIVFVARRNPTRIVLELSNGQEELIGCFRTFVQFMQKWLPIWISKYLEVKTEDISAASTSSEFK